MSPPVRPVPAATLVLLRDRAAGGFEILLTQRHRASKFAGGDHVFPGGKVGPDDNPPDAARWCADLDPARAAEVLGTDPATALAFWIGAIRETFEESGLLLAYDASGTVVRNDVPRFEDYRRACQAENPAFWDMVRAEHLTLATDRLVYLAHWITPEENPMRFDTRFFAALAPEGQDATRDAREVIDVRWLAPDEALAAAKAGEISLRNPTMRNLELFLGARSAAQALDRVRGRTITPIRPRIVMEQGQRRVLMPGDAGYW